MGFSKAKIEKMAQLRKLQEEYQEWIRTLDLKPIVDYFERGVEANQFRDQNNKILGRNDQLFWGFNHAGYQYTLRRQPLRTTGKNMNSLINDILQKGITKGFEKPPIRG
jgi:hypothetical protein